MIFFLEQNNKPFRIFDAQELAQDLYKLVPISDEISIFDGGGVLAYLFLKRAGYQGRAKEVLRVKREYTDGKPVAVLQEKPVLKSEICIDDILASGQTLRVVLEEYGSLIEFVCLLASSNIPKGRDKYRERQRTTVSGVKKLYCAQFVNGCPIETGGNLKPAILSLRYLVTKAIDNQDYQQNYLARKFGGPENVEKLTKLLKGVNRAPLDLLRRNADEFLRKYGAEVQK